MLLLLFFFSHTLFEIISLQYHNNNIIINNNNKKVYNQNFVTAISDDLNDEFCNHPKTEWVSGVPIYTQIKSININLLGLFFFLFFFYLFIYLFIYYYSTK